MIHATIHGVLAEDAEYRDARRSSTQSRQAVARFTLVMRRDGIEQSVICEFRGQRAASIESELVAGKRVIVSGALRLPIDGDAARLNVDRCELVGGAWTTRRRGGTETPEHGAM